MADIDVAHLLFPSDAPASVTPAPSASEIRSPTITPLWKTTDHAAADPARAPAGNDTAAKSTDDIAAKLFDTERQTDSADAELYGSIEKLDDLADAVRMSGDDGRATALREAGTFLVEEAREYGMPSDDLRGIVDLVHEASATVSAMTPERLAEGQARAERELASSGVSDADIDLARGLIRKMSEKIPNLTYQLEATGLGNDARFIRAVIKEAKRRGGF